jgi:hypothetical protein
MDEGNNHSSAPVEKTRVENYSESGLDILDIIRVYERKQRAYQWLLLNSLEEIVPDKTLFVAVRKIVLDNLNDLGRSFARAIVGEDVER